MGWREQRLFVKRPELCHFSRKLIWRAKISGRKCLLDSADRRLRKVEKKRLWGKAGGKQTVTGSEGCC